MRAGDLNGFSAAFDDRVLIKRLENQGGQVLPDAVARALNETADAITMQSRLNVSRRLTVRTQFTLNSIRTKNRARGRNVSRMFARTGTISNYLPIQNTGGIMRARGRSIVIPTISARSGSNKNIISPRFRMNRMGNFGPSYGGKTTRFFMGTPKGGNRRAGIYFRSHNNKKLTMVRNVESSTVQVPGSAWFDDAIKGAAPTLPDRFRRIVQAILGVNR